MRKKLYFYGSEIIALIVGNDIIFLSINFTAMETISQIYNAVLLLLGKIGKRGHVTLGGRANW